MNIAPESENLPPKHDSIEKSPSNGEQKNSKKDKDATPKNNLEDLGGSMSPKAQTPNPDAQNFSVKLKQAQIQSALGGKMKNMIGPGSESRKVKTADNTQTTFYNQRFMNLPTSVGTSTMISSMNPSKLRDHTIYTHSQGSKRPGHIPPENHNNLYGSYYGQYSKSYVPSFNGTFDNRYISKKVNTREETNQEGKDIDYDEVSAYVHSPVKFHLQRRREIFHKRDGCMVGNANENRFVSFNDTPLIRTKHIKY